MITYNTTELTTKIEILVEFFSNDVIKITLVNSRCNTTKFLVSKFYAKLFALCLHITRLMNVSLSSPGPISYQCGWPG